MISRSLALLVSLLIGTGVSWARDNKVPRLQITQPTTQSTFTTTAVQLTVAGTASDNVGVVRVTWQTDHGTSGTATGTTAWSFPVSLPPGATRVTVTAQDAAGNRATAILTITSQAPPPPPPTPTSHVLEWDYSGTASQFLVDQCVATTVACPPTQQVAVVAGNLRTVELMGLDSTKQYCWRLRLPSGQVSNRVGTLAACQS